MVETAGKVLHPAVLHDCIGILQVAVEPAVDALDDAVLLIFTGMPMSSHVPDVLQAAQTAVPTLRRRRRQHFRGLSVLSPSVLFLFYVELADVIYLLCTMPNIFHVRRCYRTDARYLLYRWR